MGQSSLIVRFGVRAASEEAATAVEYAIMAALIAGLIIAIVVTLGLQTASMFELANSNLDAATK